MTTNVQVVVTTNVAAKRVTPVTSRSVDAIGAGVDLQVVPDAVDGSSTGM